VHRLCFALLVGCAPLPAKAPVSSPSPAAAPTQAADPPLAADDTPAPDDHAPCTANGCLRSHYFVGRFSLETVQSLLAAGVQIDNGYAVYVIRYMSGGGEVGATIAVPLLDAPVGGWHVVVNNHGTTGVADVCAITGTTWGSGLAGELGARGMIGVAPDYEGLGAPGVHPYLVTESEGQSALDAVRAAFAFADELRIPTSRRAAVVGLSQGGHAALAAAALHASYAPELDIRAFAASGPATVREELWRPALTVAGDHVVYHALVAYAWSKHYGFAGPSPFASALAPTIDDVMEKACAFSPSPKTPLLLDLLPHDPQALFAPAFLHGYTTGEWGAYADFHAYFTKNRAGPYTQTAPLRIYQGDADDTVPEPQTAAYVSDLRAAGQTVDYVVVPGGGHTDVAFSFVAVKQLRSEDAAAWLRDRLSLGP
jgi:S-formylglutathione hydrolase FrmB